MKHNINAIILGGGRGKRIGKDKIKLKIKDRFLIEIIIDKIYNIFDEIIVVLNKNNFNAFPRYVLKKFSNVKIIKDECNISASLIGIYSGLKFSSSNYNFVFACDMPYVNVNLVNAIIKKIDLSDVIVPKYTKNGNEFLEPLFAIYSKMCENAMKEQIEKGKYQIKEIFSKLNVKYINENYLKKFDPSLISFSNINTKEDYSYILQKF